MYTVMNDDQMNDDTWTYERSRILDGFEAQLEREPAKQTRNRKMIVPLVPNVLVGCVRL
uniref:Uncharacterized protein n=1 Tax=Candidatus Kentrum sp. SD TaxID=2126332 RepID=A0A450YKN7_9GAMM|nr:MAG: hypothetical protein BECKSD772F_GA0070984_100834 [Candidatus Kentron sp. SD]VFK42092.1 MAG: hypothetical protein BECKSD772E_GA0070983_10148 [Candidatus Kentron sp. SD]VFK78127.1 MAG: hypothetical protein BECKSD772D_GA0070982_100734 [Candidatus Kentron sp. SD]